MPQQGNPGFEPFPESASWHHLGARAGYEVAFFRKGPDGQIIDGTTAAYEDEAWIVSYRLVVGDDWVSRETTVTSKSRFGQRETDIRLDDGGQWWVDGNARPDLSGCRDIDLESSAVTNTLPVHRLALPARAGRAAEAPARAPAVYVRAIDLTVERLDQRYLRLPDDGENRLYQYESPAFDFHALLTFDSSGLVLDYPGIARRHT